ncbi:MAG: hypothetical protein JRJ24_12360 [Deltaproteobacteria bacterium]|nr:hypothetical protein [Deltaproteobacteria bacterium]
MGVSALTMNGDLKAISDETIAELPDGLIDAALDYAGRLPSDQTEIFFGRLGGLSAPRRGIRNERARALGLGRRRREVRRLGS